MTTVIGDTNIFLRFLTKDVLKQALKVKKIFHQAEQGYLKIFVLHITVVEILFQLENWYDFSSQEASEKLIVLFSPSWLETEDKDGIFEALQMYKNSRIDFVDILTAILAKRRNLKILSFDKDYDKLIPKIRLEP